MTAGGVNPDGSTSWWARLRRLFGATRHDSDAMTCAQVLEVLQGYLDGEVDADTARRVTEHLSSCDDCAIESDTYRRIKASLAVQADQLGVQEPEPIDPVVRARLEQFVRTVGAD